MDLNLAWSTCVFPAFRGLNTEAGILAVRNKERGDLGRFRGGVIIIEFGYRGLFVLVILMITNVGAEILFDNYVNPFRLAVSFRIEGRRKISSYT